MLIETHLNEIKDIEENEYQIQILETKKSTEATIKAIGIGGGGGNMVNYMIAEGIKGIDFISANTDAQDLTSSDAPFKIQLGPKLSRGLGAGMDPQIGHDSALESYNDIKDALNGADIVFVAAGLGGGTGTGAAPIVVQAAKEVGALTVSIVTKPFEFEGKRRAKLAKKGLEDLQKECDSIIVIPNDKLLSAMDEDLGITEAFQKVDDILAQAIRGISNVIISHGKRDINLDFADVKTVMSYKGLAIMGTGYSTGDDAAYEAAKAAIESPLLDNNSIDGALGVLVHCHINPNYSLRAINKAISFIENCVDDDAPVIFGTTTDDSFEEDEVKITIIATGFKNKNVDSQVDTEQVSIEQVSSMSENTISDSLKKIIDEYSPENATSLDVPTFIRKQMD